MTKPVNDGVLAVEKIAFIGAGYMGSAIIRGLIKSQACPASRLVAFDPAPGAAAAMAQMGVVMAKDIAEAARGADVVILAVKPQIMAKVAATLKESLEKKTLVVSIAAGVTTANLESWLGSGAKVVRAMPNMAATVMESATAVCRGKAAGDGEMALALAVLGSVGGGVEVDETMMDAVTGLSGSGPAYVFMFLEGLIDAGVRCGLPRDTAAYLARQTLYGSALLAMESGEHPSLLKERITSPGGTTMAALAALEEDGFRGSIINAVTAAMERSRELGEK